MKNYRFIYIALIACICLSMSSCKQEQKQRTIHSIVSETIDIEEAKQKLAEGKFTFIDLRTPEEIMETGKIDGALELDFRDNKFNSNLAALDRDKAYVIYCAAGGRSGKTAGIMRDLGFKEVYDMNDGYSEWKERNN